MDNNLLFLISAEGVFNTQSNRANWFLPAAFTVFLSRIVFIKSAIFESFRTLQSIITIPCLSQLILSGTARNKCLISKCACLHKISICFLVFPGFHRMIMLPRNFEIFRNNICVTNGMWWQWYIGCLREIMKNAIVRCLFINGGILCNIVFCIFVFVTYVFLSSRFLDKS